MNVYVYRHERAAGVYVVGFYRPDGKFEPESDHERAEDAGKRVAEMNGAIEPCPRPHPARSCAFTYNTTLQQWETSCRRGLQLGVPDPDGFSYCPYCGGHLPTRKGCAR